MDNETDLAMEDGVEVPESVLLRRDRGHRYGSVPGLDDSELADPDELERQVFVQEFGPVLALPVKAGRGFLRPSVDEEGTLKCSRLSSRTYAGKTPSCLRCVTSPSGTPCGLKGTTPLRRCVDRTCRPTS